MRKPLCSGFSCPCAFYIVLLTILFFLILFRCVLGGFHLPGYLTFVFKASVFLDELLHSAVCQLGGFTCVFLFACSLLSLSLYTFLFVFHQVTKLWLNMDYFPFIQICLGVFILATILLQTKLSLFKIQVTYNLDL